VPRTMFNHAVRVAPSYRQLLLAVSLSAVQELDLHVLCCCLRFSRRSALPPGPFSLSRKTRGNVTAVRRRPVLSDGLRTGFREELEYPQAPDCDRSSTQPSHPRS